VNVIVTHLMRFHVPRIGSKSDPRGEPIGGPAATRRIHAGGITEEAPHSLVRPLPNREAERLSIDDLAVAGRPYQLGAVLELVNATDDSNAWYPAEEYRYDDLVVRKAADGDRLWDACTSIAGESLEELVGHPLTVDEGWVSLPNRGWQRTLGVLAGSSPPVLTVIRGWPVCQFREPHLGEVHLIVSDVRFYRHEDGEIVDPAVIEDVNRRLQSGVEFQIAIEIPPSFPLEHPCASLRVGGLHLRDDPCWGTAPASA
jgi:hypothetical protein